MMTSSCPVGRTDSLAMATPTRKIIARADKAGKQAIAEHRHKFDVSEKATGGNPTTYKLTPIRPNFKVVHTNTNC